jgi:hypothetical protein
VVVAALGPVEDLPVDDRVDALRSTRVEMLLHLLEDPFEDDRAVLARHPLFELLVRGVRDDLGERGGIDFGAHARASLAISGPASRASWK